MDLEGRGDEEKMGRVNGGKTLIEVYYVRKKSIFNQRKTDPRKAEIIPLGFPATSLSYVVISPWLINRNTTSNIPLLPF